MRQESYYCGHYIEIRYSPTSSLSSWHLDELEKENINVWITSDVAYFMRVDKKDIYRIDNCNALKCFDKVKEIDDIWVNDNETGEYLFNEYLASLKKYPTVEEIIESSKNRMKSKQDNDDNDKDI